MISNPFFLLSLLLSALFSFLTVALFVEILVTVFRIKHHRIRSVLRLLPFFSLIIDLLFTQNSISSWLNPLHCASCVQKIFLDVFVPKLKIYLVEHDISLLTHLGSIYNNTFFSIIFILFGTICIFFVLKTLIRSFSLTYSLHAVAKRAEPIDRIIENKLLSYHLQKKKVKITISDETLVPLTIYPNVIIIPKKNIDILSQEELEAVIAHELEHIKYRDPLARFFYHLVAAFFWWIPTQSWISKIEQGQELACDQNVLGYGFEEDSLASALYKVAKQVKAEQTICYFANHENTTFLRIRELLGMNHTSQYPIIGLKFFGLLLGAILLLICSLWI